MIARRSVIAGMAGLALGPGAALTAHGQQPARRFRVGVLGVGMAEGSAVHIDAFKQALRELGHVEGGNIVY